MQAVNEPMVAEAPAPEATSPIMAPEATIAARVPEASKSSPSLAAADLVPVPLVEAAPAPAAALAPTPDAALAPGGAPVAVSQCNGTDNVGGRAVACDVTVTNNLNLATNVTSSTVEVKECHGAANAALPCTTTITPSDQLVTSVDQCNGSGSGGGGTVECNVTVVNNITGASPAPTPATINQCNGTGQGAAPSRPPPATRSASRPTPPSPSVTTPATEVGARCE